MIITLKDKDGNPVIQIRSMSDGLNYQIFRKPTGRMADGKLISKKNKEIKSEWIFTECYCQSIEHALSCALEKYLKQSADESEIKVTGDVYKKLKAYVDKRIKELTATVEKEVGNGKVQ